MSHCWRRSLPGRTVIDPKRIAGGDSQAEIQRLSRMKKLLIENDPKVESEVSVRRAIVLLAQLRTPEAIGLLKDLAKQDSRNDVGRLASAALDRLAIPRRP